MGESSKDDDDQFKSVHALSSDNIGEVSKTKLTENSSAGGSDLDGGIRVGGNGSVRFAVIEIDHTQHASDQVDGEDLVIVRLEFYQVKKECSHRRNQ